MTDHRACALSASAVPLARRGRSRGTVWVLLASLWLATACAGTGQRRATAYQAPTIVSVAVTMGPGALPVEDEQERLARMETAPAQLRLAWLQLQQRQARAALDSTARVLYGTNRPTANEEAFARYLRAEAFALDHAPERGAFDLQRANELAVDPELRRLLAKATPHHDEAAAVVAGADLVIQPRRAWQPAPVVAAKLDAMQRPRRVTIHHSAMYFRDTRPAACATQIQQIQREHMRGRGYGDIGYHFLIDPSGRIWEGREMKYQGAHALGDNNVANIGICVLGNFMRGRNGQGPTPQQVDSMQRLVLQLMQRYRFGADAILCHSDLRATECPGPLMEGLVQQFARELQRTGGRLAAAASP